MLTHDEIRRRICVALSGGDVVSGLQLVARTRVPVQYLIDPLKALVRERLILSVGLEVYEPKTMAEVFFRASPTLIQRLQNGYYDVRSI